MIRETNLSHKIALLATGDEIARGDIINSNSQEIALRLVNEGMEVRMHMVAPDSINEIEQAMRFLLSSHQALIITGGLGPTSDDLTRHALSKVLDRPLLFHEASWDAICTRLKRFGYPTPPESNRQQALFPTDTTIIPNPNGTAAGCMAEHNGQWIFMLPGPPNECLPMIDSLVLPTLKKANFQHISYHHKWLLFGVSEGKIAEELDTIAKPFDCITGYRLFYPYIEFKLHSNNQKDFNTLVSLIEKTIQPYLIGDGQKTASSLLRAALAESNTTLGIADHATCGALEAAISTPKTREKLHFSDQTMHLPLAIPQIEIRGLTEFWQAQQDATHTQLQIIFFDNEKQNETGIEIPFRGKRVIQYAVEFICHQILLFINEAD